MMKLLVARDILRTTYCRVYWDILSGAHKGKYDACQKEDNYFCPQQGPFTDVFGTLMDGK